MLNLVITSLSLNLFLNSNNRQYIYYGTTQIKKQSTQITLYHVGLAIYQLLLFKHGIILPIYK